MNKDEELDLFVSKTPTSEDEEQASKSKTNIEGITTASINKDESAQKLIIRCIRFVAVIWLIDFLFGKIELSTPFGQIAFGGSQKTEVVIELFKYVISASIGYFFGTATSKKE